MSRMPLRHLALCATVLGSVVLGGCVAAPSTRSDPPGGEVSVPIAPPPSTRVYVYPSGGQVERQLDRDRYECHMWAVRQTRFDPSEPHLAPHQRVQVVAMPPPGTSTLAGAATGAIIGAAVSSPYNTGSGAAIGAVAGAVLGAAADSSRQQEANRVQQQYDRRDSQSLARLEEQANDYRRAIGACLEGRGYTVK